MPNKVALIYGFGEGPWHGRRFIKHLQAAGLTVTEDTKDADIVITHSAGALYIPKLREQQIIMLIGPPHWPGKNPIMQMIHKIAIDIWLNAGRHPLFLLQKTAHNLLYIFGNFHRTKEIIKLGKTFDLVSAIDHHRTIIVRNSADPWLTPQIHELTARYPNLLVRTAPGDHDDCWLHPDRYINLLQSEV